MDKNNFFIKSQIRSNIHSIQGLLNTGVFQAPVLRSFQEPAFVSIMLKLNDLLQMYDKLGNRINFTDDISSGNITDLVNSIRNAICHLGSPENLLDKESELKFVFNMVTGKGNVVAIKGKVIASSDYEDDIAFFYGEYRIYLRRHVIRVFTEATGIFRKLYPDEVL